MCGIAGIVHFNREPVERTVIQRMTDAMGHRGPDADGFFVRPEVALGHRRLSIIDLSEAANQPFADNEGRYILIFNGEIYNYEEIKPLLMDYAFRTNGDSEVLLAAYIKWGPECIGYLRGMFSFAIWDCAKKEIFIARDPMGVKPLYYYLDDQMLIFASEIRAILGSGLVKRKINPNALLEYFSYQSVSGSSAIVDGIQQLDAGSWIRVANGQTEKKRYWDLTDMPVHFDWTKGPAVRQKVRDLMLQSVKRRMVSDVPVAAFLSGGIDSSAVVGLMAETGARPNSFHVAFDEKQYDESTYADLVASKFNTNHTRLLIKPDTFLDELHNALDAMDTPTGDGINSYVVSKAVRSSGMKVALSGVGGDELFAGYPFFSRYAQLRDNRWLWSIPPQMRTMPLFLLPKSNQKDRMTQLLRAPSPSIVDVYPIIRQIVSPELLDELCALPHPRPLRTALQKGLIERSANIERLPLLSQVSAAEYLGYTQYTLLKDADQMSMAVSLELREPFFDQDLVEFILSVPDSRKKPTYPKSLLVESLKPLLPDEIVFRKKQGFLFPWELWLKNELRSFCNSLIKKMADRPFVHADRLISYWQRFLTGDRSIRWAGVWLFVVLEYWLEKNQVES